MQSCEKLDFYLICRLISIDSLQNYGSFGRRYFDHLTAHGACFPGSQVTIVAAGQIDADFVQRYKTY